MNLILQAIKSLFRKVEASRTHWDTRQTVTKKITFDGSMEGKETVPIDEWSSCVKVSEEVPTVDDVIGATIAYYNEGDTFSETVVADTIFEVFHNAYVIGAEDTVLLVLADLEGEEAPPLTKGVWAIRELDENGTLVYYPTSFEYTVTTGELKKLDEKYLPDGVARVEQVEAVQATAETAQATAEYAQTTAESIPKFIDASSNNTLSVVQETKEQIAIGDHDGITTSYSHYVNLLDTLPVGSRLYTRAKPVQSNKIFVQCYVLLTKTNDSYFEGGFWNVDSANRQSCYYYIILGRDSANSYFYRYV